MAYPGNPELSTQAQERVMTAFRQAVAKLQDGQREEAMIGLEFVLRLDPAFTPAVNLRQQLSSEAQEIDLSEIIAQLQAPTTATVDEQLVEAVESFNQRNFLEAKERVEKALIELPGHEEARQLLRQINDALKVENQVGQFLAQAREALDQGDAQEAANFVMMAQALDPHHSGIAPTLQEIYDRGGLPQQEAAAPDGAETVDFETSDAGADGFAVQFDDAAPAPEAPEPLVEPAPTEFVPPAELGTPVELSTDEPDAAPWDSVAEEAPAPEPEGPPPPPEAQPAAEAPAGDLFESEPEPAAVPDVDDISDLFEAEPEADAMPPPAVAAEAEPDRTQLLNQQGEAAFEAGDYLVAIDAWSRIYLYDPADDTLGPRIQEARQRLDDVERRIEHMFFDAQDANLSGEVDKARKLADEILALQPNNAKAIELRERLGGEGEPAEEAATGGGVHEMPDLDEDLFEEGALAATADAAGGGAGELALEWEEPEARRILGLPMRTAAMIGGGVVAVAVILGLAGGLFFGSEEQASGDIFEVRAQAEQLYRDGNPRQALRLVEGFRVTDPADEKIVKRLIAKYQRALATPTPTPIPAHLVAARELLERGLWCHAYSEVMAGLRRDDDDFSLLEIKQQIEEQEPMVSVLHTALSNANFQSAAGIARDLLTKYQDQPDIVEVLERSLFNAALGELRAYNLTGAEAYLSEYDERRPDDEVVERILEFIGKYKARPVDMTLQVFIGSLEERGRRKLGFDEEGRLTRPTQTPVPAASPTAEVA
jgi:tetratricopeptide (TPR) repeat protein